LAATAYPRSASVKTEMGVEDQAGGGYTDEDIEGRVPMGRFAGPEQSAFVNGHTLSVDGGWFGDGSWESLRRRKQGEKPG
jgi:NAD(P)-dependent dehydrogenase (short-subunit alcohol dehydrogenase family)